jgi:hypothetical protein
MKKKIMLGSFVGLFSFLATQIISNQIILRDAHSVAKTKYPILMRNTLQFPTAWDPCKAPPSSGQKVNNLQHAAHKTIHLLGDDTASLPNICRHWRS